LMSSQSKVNIVSPVNQEADSIRIALLLSRENPSREKSYRSVFYKLISNEFASDNFPMNYGT